MRADGASELKWIVVWPMVAECLFRMSEQVLPIDEGDTSLDVGLSRRK